MKYCKDCKYFKKDCCSIYLTDYEYGNRDFNCKYYESKSKDSITAIGTMIAFLVSLPLLIIGAISAIFVVLLLLTFDAIDYWRRK